MRLVGGVEEMKIHILALATLISFGDWEQYSDAVSIEPKVIDIHPTNVSVPPTCVPRQNVEQP